MTNASGNVPAVFLSGVTASGQSNTFYSRIISENGGGIYVAAGAYISLGDIGTQKTNKFQYITGDSNQDTMTNGATSGFVWKTATSAAGGGTAQMGLEGVNSGKLWLSQQFYLVSSNGIASYATNTTLSMTATGLTNTLTVNVVVAGFTGSSVVQTNASGFGFSRGTVSSGNDIVLQPGAKLMGNSCAANAVYAW